MSDTTRKAGDGPDISPHRQAEDWCHLCGQRSMCNADVWYSANAEHGGEQNKYLRVCGQCGGRISAAANDVNTLHGMMNERRDVLRVMIADRPDGRQEVVLRLDGTYPNPKSFVAREAHTAGDMLTY